MYNLTDRDIELVAQAEQLTAAQIKAMCQETDVKVVMIHDAREFTVRGWRLGSFTVGLADGTYKVRTFAGLVVTGQQFKITAALRFLWIAHQIAEACIDPVHGTLRMDIPEGTWKPVETSLRACAAALNASRRSNRGLI